MASFDRAIPPGGEGQISLSVKTKGYEGTHVWDAAVHTNDPQLPILQLRLKAFVETPILLAPRYVLLQGKAASSVVGEVEINAGLDKPLVLSLDQSNLEGKVSYALEETEAGKRFRLRFTTLSGPPRQFAGFLNLKTNYPEKPVLNIRVWARLTE